MLLFVATSLRLAGAGNTSAKTITSTPDFTKGLDYINSQLDNEKPVIVGVHYEFGRGINELTTDHFVVIIGRGCEDGKQYFRFYEVGTSFPEKGQSLLNKLYVNNDSITGSPYGNVNKVYTVSQVRRNK